MKQRVFIWCLFLIVITAVTPAFAESVLVAVAANFVPPFREIAMEFERVSGHSVRVVPGASGTFYAQIKNGAPFDLFFSADVERPKVLEEDGLGVQGSRVTYAIGHLVLWSPNPDLLKGAETLTGERFKHLAIANPKTAPYGAAAMQTMQKLGVWEKLQPRIVMGENLGQTMGFIESGNAELGFVSLSQALDPKLKIKGAHWEVPTDLHDPIRQDVLLLVKGKNNPAATALLEFVKHPKAKEIIERYGYRIQ